jgi:hypothetical protein
VFSVSHVTHGEECRCGLAAREAGLRCCRDSLDFGLRSRSSAELIWAAAVPLAQSRPLGHTMAAFWTAISLVCPTGREADLDRPQPNVRFWPKAEGPVSGVETRKGTSEEPASVSRLNETQPDLAHKLCGVPSSLLAQLATMAPL